jgi:hypothetical protein
MLGNVSSSYDEEALPISERSAAYFVKEIITKINRVISSIGLTL